MDNQELIRLIQTNPETGFRQILSENKERIYWHVRKMVHDHDDANDLTQETFIKVWNNLTTFKGESKIHTWIYRIATNLCLTFLEKKKKVELVELNNIQEPGNKGTFLESEQIITKLLQALKVVPPKQRLVFNLKYFDNMKYTEIAELTNNSVGALKTSYHLAVKKIEEFLNQD